MLWSLDGLNSIYHLFDKELGGVAVLCSTAGTRLDTGVPGVNGIVVDFAHGAHILVGTNI